MKPELTLQEIDATAGEIVKDMGPVEAFAYAKQLQKVAEVIEQLTKDEVSRLAIENGELYIGPLRIIYTRGRESLVFSGIPEYEQAELDLNIAKDNIKEITEFLKKKGLGEKVVGQPGVMTKWAKDA